MESRMALLSMVAACTGAAGAGSGAGWGFLRQPPMTRRDSIAKAGTDRSAMRRGAVIECSLRGRVGYYESGETTIRDGPPGSASRHWSPGAATTPRVELRSCA